MQDWRKNKLVFAILMAPASFWLILFFTIPLAIVWVYSFGGRGPEGQTLIQFSFANYSRALEWIHLGIIWKSIVIATITTAACLALGFPLALAIAFAPSRLKNVLLLLVILPFWTNLLIRCYAWMLMLQTTGVLNELLVDWLHVLTAPLPLMFNLTGVVIGMVHYLVPINILVLFSVMKAIDLRLLQAAKGLGANPLRAFVAVFVPLSMPGVRASAMLIFVISLGFFVTPALLGGRREITVAMLVSTYFSDVLNWGFGSALATVLLVLSLIGLALYFAFQRKVTPVVPR